MATSQTTPFDELARLASDFVAAQRGSWDHQDWVDLLARARAKGIDVSAEMQASLGALLEALKDYHTAVASTEGLRGATDRVFDNSVAFVKRQNGRWGHSEWEDFVRTVQENTRAWSGGTEAYVGGVLESLKGFYSLFPAVTTTGSAPAEEPQAVSKPSPAPNRRPEPREKRDDLTVLPGLGPAIAKKLNQEGIVRYAQLAALSESEIAHLEKNVIKSSGRFKRHDWVGQARKLSEG